MAIKWTWVSNAWKAFGHAANAYTLAALLSWLLFGSTVLGVLYAIDDYSTLSGASQAFFGVAVFAGLGLLVLVLGPWCWEHRPLSVTASSEKLAPVLLSAPSHAAAATAETVEIQLEELSYQEREPWVHVRVINKGAPDDFTAQVIAVSYSEQPQKQYTVKWREGDESVRRVFKDDLLNLAQVVPPVEVNKPAPRQLGDLSPKAERRREDAEFRRGYFRLFSVTQPGGWEVYGREHLIEFFLGKSTIPPEERPLLIFDERLELRVRVMGTRGQQASGVVRLAFKRPEWDYDEQRYRLSFSTATFTPDT